jgi:hypothetical protein
LDSEVTKSRSSDTNSSDVSGNTVWCRQSIAQYERVRRSNVAAKGRDVMNAIN